MSNAPFEDLSNTTQALGSFGQGFLRLLPGIVVGLAVFGLFVLLSGFVKRAVLRATRGSGHKVSMSEPARRDASHARGGARAGRVR